MSQADKQDRQDKPLNAETISQMTYSEIMEKNRAQHKGTFMDRSWREKIPEEQPKSLIDGFRSGHYSY